MMDGVKARRIVKVLSVMLLYFFRLFNLFVFLMTWISFAMYHFYLIGYAYGLEVVVDEFMPILGYDYYFMSGLMALCFAVCGCPYLFLRYLLKKSSWVTWKDAFR